MRTSLAAALAGALLSAPLAHASTVSINSGSLGAVANGTNADGVTLGLAGPLAAPGDTAARYGGGTTGVPVNTTVPTNPALNPASASPFTIEFWTRPELDVIDGSGPAPVFNRVSSGNRSGWVFFQRASTQGWNFAMYNGTGSTVGQNLTGGTYIPGVWTQVVAVWDGTTPSLYVNGSNTGAAQVGPGGYNGGGTAIFSIGSYEVGANSYSGLVDETAYYGSALSAAQIANHFAAASNPTPGAYSSMVIGDGALLYLRNAQVPEPAAAGLMLLGLGAALRRRK